MVACSLYESELIGATSRMAAKMARFARCPKMPAFVIDVPRRSDRSDAASSPASNDRQLRAGFPASIRHNRPATADTVPDLQFLCCRELEIRSPRILRALVLSGSVISRRFADSCCGLSPDEHPWLLRRASVRTWRRLQPPGTRIALAQAGPAPIVLMRHAVGPVWALRELDQSSRGGKSCSPHSTKPIR